MQGSQLAQPGRDARLAGMPGCASWLMRESLWTLAGHGAPHVCIHPPISKLWVLPVACLDAVVVVQ
jgi:hypothetical protein